MEFVEEIKYMNQNQTTRPTTGLLFGWDEKMIVLLCVYVHVLSCYSENVASSDLWSCLLLIQMHLGSVHI